MALKNVALAALLFAAGTDARAWRNKKSGSGVSGGKRGSKIKEMFEEKGLEFDEGSPEKMKEKFQEFMEEDGEFSFGGKRGKRGKRGRGDKGDKEDKEGKGKKGKGKDKWRKGKGEGKHGGVEVLDKIEACSEEIALTCSLNFAFKVEDLMGKLEDLADAKEAKHDERRAEKEEVHAALVDACPDLVDECGLPLELPAPPADGEKPDKEEMEAIKKAFKCAMDVELDDVEDDVCAGYLADLIDEKKQQKKAKKAKRGDKEDERGPSEEVKDMLEAVRTCLQEDVMPNLDDDGACAAALARPSKGEKEEDDQYDEEEEEENYDYDDNELPFEPVFFEPLPGK